MSAHDEHISGERGAAEDVFYCVCGQPEHEPNDTCPGPEGDLSGCPYFRRYAGIEGADPEGICFQMNECTLAEEPMCVTCRPTEGWYGERALNGGREA
jgi:hypothetical protein